MKKPREPRRPIKPTKPIKPQPTYQKDIELNIPEGRNSLKDIIKSAGYNPDKLDIENVFIYYSYDDYSSYHSVFLHIGSEEVDTPNYKQRLDYYNQVVAHYKEQLVKYENDLAIYNEKLAQWKLDMIPYNEWKDEVEEKRKQKKIKELERELVRLRK
jgi:hypothetical protein